MTLPEDPRDPRLHLPSVRSVLPSGHFEGNEQDTFISQDEYYERSQLKPLMVAAPIADFFNKLSATLQIVVVSTFMMLMVAIPIGSMYLAYQMTTTSPNFVVIKNQGKAGAETAPDPAPSSDTPEGVRTVE